MKVNVTRRYASIGIPKDFLYGKVIFSTSKNPNVAYGVKRIPYKVDLTTGNVEFLASGCEDHHLLKDICKSKSQEVEVLVLRDDSPTSPSTQIS